MFECNSSELEVLRSQFVTTNGENAWNYMRRSLPMVFTENGVAMLSSVLRSDRAIEVNIAIMRVFTKLRSFYALNSDSDSKVNKLEHHVTQVFKVVFERLDNLEEKLPSHSADRNRIGIKNKN